LAGAEALGAGTYCPRTADHTDLRRNRKGRADWSYCSAEFPPTPCVLCSVGKTLPDRPSSRRSPGNPGSGSLKILTRCSTSTATAP